VEHAWLCAKCSEVFTLEYRNDHPVLVSLPIPVATAEPAVPMPPRARRRIPRPVRRPRSRRGVPSNVSNSPVVLLAITPKGDFPDRG
jgi:hypothetical protein